MEMVISIVEYAWKRLVVSGETVRIYLYIGNIRPHQRDGCFDEAAVNAFRGNLCHLEGRFY